MKLNFSLLLSGLPLLSFFTILMLGCQKNDGTLGDPGVASFTVTPVASKANTYALTSTSANAFKLQYNLGDGSATRAGKPADTAYFQSKGTYVVTLYAFGRGGYTTQTQTIVVANNDFSSVTGNATFQLLTAKTWKFDPGPGAAAIIVGTEGNPGQFFGGGPLADCQIDDTYKFSFAGNAFTLTYNANGATFNGGNLQPNFVCGADRSYTNNFVFTPGADGAGVATITMAGTIPSRFIGTTDIASNDFRIISINANSMVLRAGKKNETVFQFKFIAQ